MNGLVQRRKRVVRLRADRGSRRGGFQTRPGATDADHEVAHTLRYIANNPARWTDDPEKHLARGACRSRAGLKPAPTSFPICALSRERGPLGAHRLRVWVIRVVSINGKCLLHSETGRNFKRHAVAAPPISAMNLRRFIRSPRRRAREASPARQGRAPWPP
jgi:hypothetical protein